MPDLADIEKRRLRVLDGIAAKLPLFFLILGLLLSSARIRYAALGGSLLLVFGLISLNGMKMSLSFRSAVFTGIVLWGVCTWFAYKRFSVPVGSYDGVLGRWRLSVLTVIAGAVTVMFSLDYIRKKFRLGLLGTHWGFTVICSNILLLAGGTVALLSEQHFYADLSVGGALLLTAVFAFRVNSGIMDIVYGRDHADDAIDQPGESGKEAARKPLRKPGHAYSAGDRPVPAKQFRHHRDLKYCLYCYYPVDEPLVEDAVRCPLCGNVTSPFLWKKFQTLEPFVRKVENSIKAVISVLFLILSGTLVYAFLDHTHVALPHVMAGVVGIWALLAFPSLRLASHISERDRRGPFETLWKKRIYRIQSENNWINYKE